MPVKTKSVVVNLASLYITSAENIINKALLDNDFTALNDIVMNQLMHNLSQGESIIESVEEDF